MPEKPPEHDPLVDQLPSRYVVGIDLGTTNSAVTYVDTHRSPWRIELFTIPQLVAYGQTETRDTLPSFHYQPTSQEAAGGTLRLPWSQEAPAHSVGFMARDEGAKAPGRLIASAKSWLCHTGVDRTAQLLPWQGAADVDRLSPVEVSAHYLAHVRDAWNARFPKDPLSRQDLVVTLPASFDEVARELTVEAAAMAELPRVVLIEEPQAAFYAWVYKHDADWHKHVQPGNSILVCDIGGGTSDFTLIRVRRSETDSGERVQFHRVAVGDHLILGGDNLDLALAHHIERQLAGDSKLSSHQWDVLVRVCRRVKELLLGEAPPDCTTVSLPGAGSRVIGGGLNVEVQRDEVRELLVDGFLPRVQLDERPEQRASGFREFGLPFANDAAITRHLAAFLTAHRDVADDEHMPGTDDSSRPDVVLFNGGFFASPLLRARLLEVMSGWYRTDKDASWSPQVLDNDRLDLAVARGAAYYGMVRRGEGVRIAASLARSYYIRVEGEQPAAVCLVPGNAEPGQDFDLEDKQFSLTISQPVEFPLYVSSTRLVDRPGDMVPIDLEQMKPLPPIRTVLRTQRRSESGTLPVTLHAHLSEIGTIDLWCRQHQSERRWRLQFDIRSATQTDILAHESLGEARGIVDEEAWQRCQTLVEDVFTPTGTAKPAGLVKRLSTALDSSRQQWPPSLLRRIWDTLMQLEPGRRRSPTHEARWLNLLGYALRPGYGLAVDDWRVAETWRTVRGKLVHHAPSSRNESLILWRRIAGGLSAGQQIALAEPFLAAVRAQHRSSMTGKRLRSDPALAPHESSEVWRLLGSLELLSVPTKANLGGWIVDLYPKRKMAKVRGPMIWALGRLGQRVPVSGPLNTVIPVATSARWLSTLLEVRDEDSTHQLAVMELARRTDDRYRDIDVALRERTIDWLEQSQSPAHYVELVRDGGQLASEEQDRVFGEALPMGLRIQ